MATKTITLEIDAYECLKRAKKSDKESFSSVVRRAQFPAAPGTGTAILEFLDKEAAYIPEEEILRSLAEAQAADYANPSMSPSVWSANK